jgi:hypothetical protein
VNCTTAEQARQLVAFALRCIQGTPLADGLTPASRLQDRPQLLQAVQAVEQWLAGQPLQDLHDAVTKAAAGAGKYEPTMVGLRAACWSAFNLYQAAWSATAVASDQTARNDVAGTVGLAAYHTRRSSDEGITLPAVEYQERLFAEMFGSER